LIERLVDITATDALVHRVRSCDSGISARVDDHRRETPGNDNASGERKGPMPVNLSLAFRMAPERYAPPAWQGEMRPWPSSVLQPIGFMMRRGCGAARAAEAEPMTSAATRAIVILANMN
jgi:hypothetical protein